MQGAGSVKIRKEVGEDLGRKCGGRDWWEMGTEVDQRGKTGKVIRDEWLSLFEYRNERS